MNFIDSPHKKHKKHKKHKHKKKREADGSDDGEFALEVTDPLEEQLSPTTPLQPAIKLKIKIGGQTLGTKRYWSGEINHTQLHLDQNVFFHMLN